MAINPWLQAAGAAATSAPAREVYGSILRSARLPNAGQVLSMPANRLLRRFLNEVDSNPAADPAFPEEEEIPPPPPDAPPVPETRAPTTPGGGGGGTTTPNTGGESPEMLEALRQMQANLRAQHMTTEPPQQQLSVLDMLRKRAANAMENEEDRRIRDFGIGMLSSRSPNFFSMLGEGFRARDEGSRARVEELRRVADLERQDAAQRAEEARRIEELTIERERRAEERNPNSIANRLRLAQINSLTSGGGRTAALTAQNLRRAEAAGSAAVNNARTAASRETPPRTLTPAQENEIYNAAVDRAIQTLRLEPRTSATPSGNPAVDIPTIDPVARPAR